MRAILSLDIPLRRWFPCSARMGPDSHVWRGGSVRLNGLCEAASPLHRVDVP